jgi:hypothetical protein
MRTPTSLSEAATKIRECEELHSRKAQSRGPSDGPALDFRVPNQHAERPMTNRVLAARGHNPGTVLVRRMLILAPLGFVLTVQASASESLPLKSERDLRSPSDSCAQAEVPSLPPDTVPRWFSDDSSRSNIYRKHVIAVRFRPGASASDRGRAVAAVCGRVVGGWRMPAGSADGFYAVQVPDNGELRLLKGLIDRLQEQPAVRSAFLDPFVNPGP